MTKPNNSVAYFCRSKFSFFSPMMDQRERFDPVAVANVVVVVAVAVTVVAVLISSLLPLS